MSQAGQGHRGIDDLFHHGEEINEPDIQNYGIDWAGPVSDIDDTISFQRINCPISHANYEQLRREINPLEVGTEACGSLRSNRKGVPDDIKNVKLKKGECVEMTNDKWNPSGFQVERQTPRPWDVNELPRRDSSNTNTDDILVNNENEASSVCFT
ncbi:unnamed protein product [Mytilus coruscus]|uniref:Uncharacterized protein n=1 Tax=Mytilus coruscus TaxID=42192 RepID=A0A6J8EN81_MYTCO|nr:unnamed protein product [Mytilus coruscus]